MCACSTHEHAQHKHTHRPHTRHTQTHSLHTNSRSLARICNTQQNAGLGQKHRRVHQKDQKHKRTHGRQGGSRHRHTSEHAHHTCMMSPPAHHARTECKAEGDDKRDSAWPGEKKSKAQSRTQQNARIHIMRAESACTQRKSQQEQGQKKKGIQKMARAHGQEEKKNSTKTHTPEYTHTDHQEEDDMR